MMNKSTNTISRSAIIPLEYAGLRIDQALARLFPDFSRTTLQLWLRNQQITLNGQYKNPKQTVIGGEQVEIAATLEVQAAWEAQPIQLDIIYEDASLIVIYKPAGMVVHPAAGHWENTLVNALLHHSPQLKQLPRAGIIHRLDKQTSGLLIVAKTLAAHHHLIKQMQKHQITREYEAIVNGVLTAGRTIDAPMGRHPVHRKRMSVIEDGKTAITHYRLLEKFRAHTLIRVQLETGRTHQIRVHLSHIHHALVGDPVYGGRFKLPPKPSEKLITALRNFKRQALHAKYLCVVHPETEKIMEWEIPLPKDMQQLLQVLRKDSKEGEKL